MEPHNFLEEVVHEVGSIITFVACNEVSILENWSTTTMIASFSHGVLVRATMKSMLLSSQGLVGTKRKV